MFNREHSTCKLFTFQYNFNFLLYLLTLHQFWANDVTVFAIVIAEMFVENYWFLKLLTYSLSKMDKLSLNDNLHMQILYEQAFDTKLLLQNIK